MISFKRLVSALTLSPRMVRPPTGKGEVRLHLGCGETILPGYMNIDYPQAQHKVMRVKPDLEADITRLMFSAGSVDEIRLHHVFEHFNRVVALGLLIRWHEWLKIGGRLTIETPDFLACAEAALRETGANRMSLVRALEGDHADGWAYHIGQWYPERFVRTLGALGFAEIETQTFSTGEWHTPALHYVTAHAAKAETLPMKTLLDRADEILAESMVSPAEQPTWEVWRRQLRDFLNQGVSP